MLRALKFFFILAFLALGPLALAEDSAPMSLPSLQNTQKQCSHSEVTQAYNYLLWYQKSSDMAIMAKSQNLSKLAEIRSSAELVSTFSRILFALSLAGLGGAMIWRISAPFRRQNQNMKL